MCAPEKLTQKALVNFIIILAISTCTHSKGLTGIVVVIECFGNYQLYQEFIANDYYELLIVLMSFLACSALCLLQFYV